MIFLKLWSHRASASASASVSALMLGQCLRLGLTLMLGVGCQGKSTWAIINVNTDADVGAQCG